uniref:Cullin_Nedd8 domain-containing protein n=1 Tax=Rhabditophanes sp. KR3021 TaxID=114890 RepID=A0AC35TUM1_9BILA
MLPTQIQKIIGELLSKICVDKDEILTPDGCLSYYAGGYNYRFSMPSCTEDDVIFSIKRTRTKVPQPSNPSSVLVAEDIYYFLKEWIADYLGQLTVKLNWLSEDDLLREYNKIWTNFLLSSRHTNTLFRFLNECWITRKLEEGSHDVRFIDNMLVTEFKNKLFDKFSSSLIATALQLIKKERNNQSINSGLSSETLQSYVYMEITLYTGAISKSMPTKGSTASTFQKKDDSEKNASIESVKELNLEAIIVRIMKARKEMRHQQLVSDVVEVIKMSHIKRIIDALIEKAEISHIKRSIDAFIEKADISHIKRSIDALIEEDYIKRDANERDLYQYLP